MFHLAVRKRKREVLGGAFAEPETNVDRTTRRTSHVTEARMEKHVSTPVNSCRRVIIEQRTILAYEFVQWYD